jgi:hypothetical protein
VKIIRNRAFIKTIFLLSFISSIIIFTACSKDTDDEIPFYQEAIYIMDADGSNKTKVIDVDGCENVQFIPNSNKLLYLADNSLYTVNTDGTENVKISGGYYMDKILPKISCLTTKIVSRIRRKSNSDLVMIDYTTNEIVELTETDSLNEQYYDFSADEKIIYYSVYSGFIKSYNIEDGNTSTILNKNIQLSGIIVGDEDNVFYKEYSRYRCRIIKLNLLSFEEVVITENASSGENDYFAFKNEKLLYEKYSPYRWVIQNVVSLNISSLPENVTCPIFKNDNEILYTDNPYFPEGSIFSFYLDEVITLCSEATKPSFSKERNQISYIGRYLTNPKSKNYLTN